MITTYNITKKKSSIIKFVRKQDVLNIQVYTGNYKIF